LGEVLTVFFQDEMSVLAQICWNYELHDVRTNDPSRSLNIHFGPFRRMSLTRSFGKFQKRRRSEILATG